MTDKRNKIHTMEENVITTLCVYEIWKYESAGLGARTEDVDRNLDRVCQVSAKKILIPSESGCNTAGVLGVL